MQENLGFLIAITRRRLKQATLACAAPHGLSAPQFWLLIALREAPGVSQAELAERVHVDPPTTSRILTALGERDLVRIELDPRDRRRSRVLLTAVGERLTRQLASAATAIRSASTEGMSEIELQRIRQGLNKIISNMDRFEARASRRKSS